VRRLAEEEQKYRAKVAAKADIIIKSANRLWSQSISLSLFSYPINRHILFLPLFLSYNVSWLCWHSSWTFLADYSGFSQTSKCS
jgi:hypothetical protein